MEIYILFISVKVFKPDVSDSDQGDLHKRNAQCAHWSTHQDLEEHSSEGPVKELETKLSTIKVIKLLFKNKHNNFKWVEIWNW